MLKFTRGDPEAPSGNLLVFARVKGKNPFHPNTRIIVANVVVSFISAATNSFPVVIFPPGPLFTRKEFDLLMELNDNYDVIQVHDYEIPENVREKTYIKERMKHLNDCVYEYVELCQKHLGHKIDLYHPEIFEFEDIPPIKPKKVQDEFGALMLLSTWVKNPEIYTDDESLHSVKVALNFLKKNFTRYDVDNLEKISGKAPIDNALARLYVAKFRAVFKEEYETAAKIKNRIEKLEQVQVRWR